MSGLIPTELGRLDKIDNIDFREHTKIFTG